MVIRFRKEECTTKLSDTYKKFCLTELLATSAAKVAYPT